MQRVRGGGAAAIVLAALAAATHGASATTTRFDRTYSCSVSREYPGGPRVVEVGLSPRQEVQEITWGAGGGVGVSQGGFQSPQLLAFRTGPLDRQRRNGVLLVSATRCAQLKTRRIPLSPKGLPSPPVRFQKSVECTVTPRVLLRLRATLDRRPVFRLSSGNRIATVNFSEAAIAVATDQATPKPVAFGEIGATGQTRLFYSFSRCE